MCARRPSSVRPRGESKVSVAERRALGTGALRARRQRRRRAGTKSSPARLIKDLKPRAELMNMQQGCTYASPRPGGTADWWGRGQSGARGSWAARRAGRAAGRGWGRGSGLRRRRWRRPGQNPRTWPRRRTHRRGLPAPLPSLPSRPAPTSAGTLAGSPLRIARKGRG